ncbi:MAG: TetR/AcrR family transcriptional regulator [Phoenicibacter congonensis]|uniref:TetR/AcrR family transcriptional regulator n=1 Tax=Phoenicibacter congonensis TaxID=1944646 RepID=A0AA43UB58_9ACTN|nr:TetR/AcrR family transcriptional regulator [Phoenicibacter congonensis]
MSRPKNEQLKAQIVKEAEKQFSTVGYKNTSYTTIAEACEISRNLVQYHFPKKESLAIAFMESVLSRSMEKLGFSDIDLRGNFDAIKKVGTVFFEKLLKKPGTRLFLTDIISSRELTQSVLAFNYEWALSHVGVNDESSSEVKGESFEAGSAEDALIVAPVTRNPSSPQSRTAQLENLEKAKRVVIVRMGGFYELLYWCLKSNSPFNVEQEISVVVDAFAAALNSSL